MWKEARGGTRKAGRECPEPGLADGWELQLLAGHTCPAPSHSQGGWAGSLFPLPSQGLLLAPASEASWVRTTPEAVSQPACNLPLQESVPTLVQSPSCQANPPTPHFLSSMHPFLCCPGIPHGQHPANLPPKLKSPWTLALHRCCFHDFPPWLPLRWHAST